jgi:hypothetical protein
MVKYVGKWFAPFSAALALAAAPAAIAANVGIGNGTFYSGTLAQNLAAHGDTVTVFDNYDAQALAGLSVYIMDGNSFVQSALLDTFVYNGGTLIQLPWSFTQASFTAGTTVFTPRRRALYDETITAISTLAPNDWLLAGVTLPDAGSTTVSREKGNRFADGATQVLEWEDGTALLGYRQYGAGTIVAFNVNLLTSDATPLNADWSNRIVFNAVEHAIAAVPEPGTYAMLGTGLLALTLAARRRPRSQRLS